MKKIIKEFNVFTIQELQGEALTKAMDDIKERIIDDNFYFLERYLHDVLLEDYGINPSYIGYSLSYSQGDGLHFNTKDFFVESVYQSMLTRLGDSDEDVKKRQVLVILWKHKEEVNVYTDHTWRYAFASYLDLFCKIEESLEELLKDVNVSMSEAYAIFKEALVKEYVDIAKHLESIGYNCYEVEDNTILQYAVDNNIDFLEDGEVYHG